MFQVQTGSTVNILLYVTVLQVFMRNTVVPVSPGQNAADTGVFSAPSVL